MPSERAADGPRLLLVEDSQSDARLVRETIREVGWPAVGDGGLQTSPPVDHVERLSDAIDRLDGDVVVVLLDLDLPDSSGVDTVDALMEHVGRTPVVVLTGHDQDRTGVEAVQRGAQDFLMKDELTPRVLRRSVRYAIERAEQQRRLASRNQELALLTRLVRHEIRDDMTLVKGRASQLREHVDEAGEEYVDGMLDAAEHALERTDTVGEVLDLVEGNRESSLRPVELSGVLELELERARSLHPKATFVLETEPPASLEVRATPMLSSVFRNLLENAVEHNEGPSPTVTVDVEPRTETVVVTIADDGPGIPDRLQEDIFDREWKAIDSSGLGMGLYLVKALVETYDGDVGVESDGSVGSAFRVELRRASTGGE